MNTARFLILMGVLVGCGASLLGQSSQQQATSQSPEKPADDSSTEAGKTGKQSDENQSNLAKAKPGGKHRATTSPAKATSIRQSRLATTPGPNGFRAGPVREIPSSNPTNSAVLPVVPNQVVRREAVPTSRPIEGLNGLQLKNVRAPGARLAVSGGPVNSAQNAGVINGTDVKRKP
jgi:hypothetical protein